MKDHSESKINHSESEAPPTQANSVPSASPTPSNKEEAQLFKVYQRVSQEHPGTADAEIFERIHEWTFSDYSLSAHEFAGITKEELIAWQQRNQIKLSTGRIRPSAIDVERAYAWGHMRMAATANRLHTNDGPPSAEEILAAKNL